MKEFLKRFIFGEEEEESQLGKIRIVTPGGRMKFEANFNNRKDFERALHLIREEMEIMFDDVQNDASSHSSNDDAYF